MVLWFSSFAGTLIQSYRFILDFLKAPKGWLSGWSSAYTKGETGINALTTWGISLRLIISEKVYVKYLETSCRELIDLSWGIPSAVFVLDVALYRRTSAFSLSSKFSRNLGVLSLHMFCRPGERIRPVPRGKFWECCGNTVVVAACISPSSHCIPAQKFMSASERNSITTVRNGY